MGQFSKGVKEELAGGNEPANRSQRQGKYAGKHPMP